MKRLLCVVVLLVLCACAPGRSRELNDGTRIFQYTYFANNGDSTFLYFKDVVTGEEYVDTMGYRTAQRKLEWLQKGACYRYPVDEDKVIPVSCEVAKETLDKPDEEA